MEHIDETSEEQFAVFTLAKSIGSERLAGSGFEHETPEMEKEQQ